jgi:prephenate dehydrogenase
MQTVGIIGLGLIGGSIGLALKGLGTQRDEPAYRVIGYDSDPSRRQQAQRLRAVDQTSGLVSEMAQQVDVLIIATPVLAVRQVLAEIAPHVRATTLITDTASTKAAVLRWARELLPEGARFIGGHPMAGGTGSLEDAHSNLFLGATYCLVPAISADADDSLDKAALDTMEHLIVALGAQPLRIDAATHDRCVAAISHLPFLTAAALVETVVTSDEVEVMCQLASSGFRDASRLASGDPAMYESIALTNREAITFWLDAYLARLQAIRHLLQATESEDQALLTLFRTARQHRQTMLE